jgi:aldehyde:ferredoxin oxidoreductase
MNQKIAYINLTTGVIESTSIPIEMRMKYIGGRGLDIYLLYNHLKEKVDPLSPDNVIVISAGLLGGMLASASCRTHVTSKSPLNGYLGSTNMGGFFAPELRFAGFDHIVIKGKSPKPSYFFINDGRIEIKDGSSIWGKTSQDTQEALKKELNDEDIQTICIGPAGEKLVRFASIITRYQNGSGRTGMGAVFGSKNLKAIAARGTMGVEVKFPKEALEYDKQIIRNICSSELAKKMQRWGSAFLYGATRRGDLAWDYHFQVTDSQGINWGDIDKYSFGMDGCFGCQLHCRHRYVIKEGPYAGVYAQGPVYGSQGAWGTNVGCRKMNTILVGNYLANSYGLDTLETGSLISWAMELYKDGILTQEDTGGLKLESGNDAAVIEMIHRIGRREGLGDILAEGGLRAAQKIGKGSQKYLLQVKGLSIPHLDESLAPGQALAIAMATRGLDHLRSRPAIDLYHLLESELKNIYSKPHTYEGSLSSNSQDYIGRPWRVFWHELCSMAADMIGICEFHTVFLSPNAPSFEEFSKMIYLNTGLDISAREIWDCANRAYTLERLFNLREGYTRKDDALEDRYFNEASLSGPYKNKTLDRQKFESMIDEYYKIHGWDDNGVPTPEHLINLGLNKEPSHKI